MDSWQLIKQSLRRSPLDQANFRIEIDQHYTINCYLDMAAGLMHNHDTGEAHIIQPITEGGIINLTKGYYTRFVKDNTRRGNKNILNDRDLIEQIRSKQYKP